MPGLTTQFEDVKAQKPQVPDLPELETAVNNLARQHYFLDEVMLAETEMTVIRFKNDAMGYSALLVYEASNSQAAHINFYETDYPEIKASEVVSLKDYNERLKPLPSGGPDRNCWDPRTWQTPADEPEADNGPDKNCWDPRTWNTPQR